MPSVFASALQQISIQKCVSAQVMGDALAVWPSVTAQAELAQWVVRGCLQLAEGRPPIRGPGGRRITAPVMGGLLGEFLAKHDPGWRVSARMTLFKFLQQTQQRPFFILTPSRRGDRVSLDMDALHASAQLRAEFNSIDPRQLPGNGCDAELSCAPGSHGGLISLGSFGLFSFLGVQKELVTRPSADACLFDDANWARHEA